MSVYPMKATSEYSQALKLFSKEVGAPDILVTGDSSGEQISNEVLKKYCQLIGTTLRLLKKGNTLGQ